MSSSNLSFLTAQQQVAQQLGLDSSDSSTVTNLQFWINTAYQDVVGFYEWSWLKTRQSVAMVVDQSNTASVSSGSTSVTLGSSITESVASYYIQFSSANDWYKITTHTAGTDALIIDTAYAQTTNLTSGTCNIRKYEYSLGSDVEYVESARQSETNMGVKVLNARDYDDFGFPTTTASAVRAVYFWGHDTSNNWIFVPFPIPSDQHLIEFRYIKAITELSTDTDTPIFPPRFNSIWLDRAKMYGYEFLEDTQNYTLRFNKTENKLLDMRLKDRPGKAQLPVLESIDQGYGHRDTIRFPSEFDNHYGY